MRETERLFAQEGMREVDLSEYGKYTDIRQQFMRFHDGVYTLQQHPFYPGLSHSIWLENQ